MEWSVSSEPGKSQKSASLKLVFYVEWQNLDQKNVPLNLMNGNQRVFFSWFYPVDLISAYGWQKFSKADPAAFYFSPVNCSQYHDNNTFFNLDAVA